MRNFSDRKRKQLRLYFVFDVDMSLVLLNDFLYRTKWKANHLFTCYPDFFIYLFTFTPGKKEMYEPNCRVKIKYPIFLLTLVNIMFRWLMPVFYFYHYHFMNHFAMTRKNLYQKSKVTDFLNIYNTTASPATASRSAEV